MAGGGGWDGTGGYPDGIMIWDIEADKCVKFLKHKDPVQSICFCHIATSQGGYKNLYLASASLDKTIKIWDVSDLLNEDK